MKRWLITLCLLCTAPPAALADANLQAFQHTIFTQDQPVLESQRPKRLPISDTAPVQELHCAADRSASVPWATASSSAKTR